MSRNKKVRLFRIAAITACWTAYIACVIAIDIRAMDKKKG